MFVFRSIESDMPSMEVGKRWQSACQVFLELWKSPKWPDYNSCVRKLQHPQDAKGDAEDEEEEEVFP